jgi:IMP dehydrogenase
VLLSGVSRIEIPLGLSYDDVLLVPKYSKVQSRSDVNLRTKLTKTISLNVPLVSANMDTVTEGHMAIAMARQGGIGIIHQFMTIEEQAAQVKHVKRSTSYVIDQPLTIDENKTVEDALQLMEVYGIKGLLVINYEKKFVGILTQRDVLFETNFRKLVKEVMTPKDRAVVAPAGTKRTQAKELMHKHKVEKLPLIDADGTIHGLITAKDILDTYKYTHASRDEKGRLLVGAAVGVKEGYIERVDALLQAGVDLIVVDIAHGHSDLALRTVIGIKQRWPTVQILAGNVATAAGCEALIKAGVDAIKVGVGPGAGCITRVVAGAGVPQLTAVMDCVAVAREHDVPVMADGGIKASGDVAKAIAAGAHTVMCGSMFAGTDQSPGFVITRNGKRYKEYRGSASYDAHHTRKQRETGKIIKEKISYVPEGVAGYVPYKGSVTEVIHRLIGGLRSGVSYCGATTIDEMHQSASFVRITASGMRESKPHDIEVK